MSEFFKAFETLGSVTIEQVLAFTALIVPGFVSLRVYEMRRGGEGRKVNDALIDVVVYSFATDIVALAAFAAVSATVPVAAQPVVKGVVAVVVFLLAPVGFALAWFGAQRAMIRSGFFRETTANPWSRMADRIVRERLAVGVILTLRDGRTIGARLDGPANLLPDGQDLLFGEVWTIDPKRGTLIKPLDGSCGIVVSRTDCQTIEFVRYDDP